MLNKVVLITTGQPSVNPRVVKEADALQGAGFNVTLLYCYWIKWAHEADKNLLQNKLWHFRLIGGSPAKSSFLYLFTKARNKINTVLSSKGYSKHSIAERSQARCYNELLTAAKAIKADVYIGHNLGALPIALKAAKHNNAFAGFDFEDYHRAENEGLKEAFTRRIVFLEEKYIPGLQYISASSSEIRERVQHDFPNFKKPFFTLLNCFSIKDQPGRIRTQPDKLKLFWFSQTVGRGRGLETVVAALKLLNNPAIQLTLVGRCENDMKSFIIKCAGSTKDAIHFAGIIPPQQLPAFSAAFDVGLATEINTPLNRDICLTNKIFTYLLAGNCIIASDTNAQKNFMESYNQVGLLYKSENVKDLADKIQLLYSNRSMLNEFKTKAYTLAADTLNWEVESQKLINTIATLKQVNS